MMDERHLHWSSPWSCSSRDLLGRLLQVKTRFIYLCQQAPCFKSMYITAELALLFSQSDSEEEFEGFSEEEEEEEEEYCKRPPKATV